MTERQLIALQSPCTRAHEALSSEFARAIAIGSVNLSTILTVNK